MQASNHIAPHNTSASPRWFILKGFTTNTLDRLDDTALRSVAERISRIVPEDWSNYFWDSRSFAEDCSIVIRTLLRRI